MTTLKKGPATSTVTEQHESRNAVVARLGGALEDILIACLTLVIPMCALTAAFLALVFYYQVPSPADDRTSAYYVNYSATRLITVSSWTSTAASLITPFAMAMLAYPIARSYQRMSVADTDRNRLPTPYQLGLVIGMLGGGLSFVWQNIKYTFWKDRSRRAGILNAATAGAVLFIILTVGILAADTWLHITTSTRPYGVVEAFESVDTEYGRGINGSCFVPVPADYPYPTAPCIQSAAGQTPYGLEYGMVNSYKAFQTLANISAQDQVRLSNIDGLTLAHLIDPSSGFDMDYEASTFALTTSCVPISKRCGLSWGQYCAFAGGMCPGALSLTPDMTYSCPGSPGLSGDLLNATGTAYDQYGSSQDVGSNLGFFLQFFTDSQWEAIHYTNYTAYPNSLYFVTGAYVVVNEVMRSDPEVVADEFGDSSGVLFGCTATGYDLTFKYTNGSVVSGNIAKANDTITTNIGYAMSRHASRRGLQAYLENGMLTGAAEGSTAQDMADYFARAYSQIAVGITSTIMSPRPSIQQQGRQNILVARLPKAPFYTLLILNVLYAFFGLVLGIWALCSNPRTTRDVQARLSVAGLVASLLEPERRSVKGEGIGGLFSERHRPGHSSEKRVAIRQVDKGRWAFQVVPGDTVGEMKTFGDDSVVAEPDDGLNANGHDYPLLSLTARGPRRALNAKGNHEDTGIINTDVTEQVGQDYHSQSAPLMQQGYRTGGDADSASFPSARIPRKPIIR